MLSISAVAKQEKNKLSTGSVFVILLDIDTQMQGDIIRICYNTEDITWHGNLYQAFPFEIGEVGETTDGSDPNVELRIDNTSRALSYYVEASGGAVNMPVTLRVVNTENMQGDAELEEKYVILKTSAKEDFVTFTLGAEYSARTRRPLNRYMKNSCPFKYKGLRCGYNGNIATCAHTLTACRNHNNSKRFGGFPGIDQKGVYI